MIADLGQANPELVLAWCKWWDKQPGAEQGVLVEGIRSGKEPPRAKRSLLEEQKAYAHSIRDWLITKMPDVCRSDPRVVAGERRCYGDASADRLERDTLPHPAAMAAVIRLHYRVGKVTVGAHGAEIRAAVRAANEQAIADYEAIAHKRAKEQT